MYSHLLSLSSWEVHCAVQRVSECVCCVGGWVLIRTFYALPNQTPAGASAFGSSRTLERLQNIATAATTGSVTLPASPCSASAPHRLRLPSRARALASTLGSPQNES
jgi:hypothetical protein